MISLQNKYWRIQNNGLTIQFIYEKEHFCRALVISYWVIERTIDVLDNQLSSVLDVDYDHERNSLSV